MELKKGYKQTEAGLIPDDWKLDTIGSIADVKGGGTPSTTVSNFWNGSINWFTPTEIGDRKFVFESKRKITIEGLNNSSAKILPKGTILLTTRAGIGDLAILKSDSSTNQGFQSLIVKENISNEFVYYLMSISKSKLLEKASGSTFLEISPNNIKSIQIALPPLKEQQAIAQVLSDTGALVHSLEKKLAKKRAIKQGAMQQLLTPKEDWEVKKLGDVFNISSANSKKEFFSTSGKYIVMDMGSVSSKGKIIRTKRANCNFDILKKGDLVMPKDDIGGGNIIGRTGYIDKDDYYVLSDHVYKLAPLSESLFSLFFSYLINDYRVHKSLRSKASGSAQLGLGKNQVLNQELIYPKTKEEQIEIATILSDMDAEIEKLEQKLAKYKQLKQGLMQQLLTGKIRLI